MSACGASAGTTHGHVRVGPLVRGGRGLAMQRSHADGCAGARSVCFIGKGHSSDAQAETVTAINGHSCRPLPLEMNAPHSIDREREGRETWQAGA
jgi:hypothetical protein